MRRSTPAALLLGGTVLASVFMALSGFFTSAAPLLAQRLLAGVASAFVFIAGGLLAARLGARQPQRAGFLMGLFYGGTGIGIVVSALGVPWVLEVAAMPLHGWAWAWWGLAGVCLLASVVMVWPARLLARADAAQPMATHASSAGRVFRVRDFAFALAGYGGFGVGDIGCMTFVIALLREQGASTVERRCSA